MKKYHLFLMTVLFIILNSFSTSKVMATSWAYPFVVWDGYIYVVGDEYVTEIESEIGQVTKFSDMEQYTGNFSNVYQKGTKYYSLEGISTEEAIAIEESEGRYIKAYREGEYEFRGPFNGFFDGTQGIIKILIFSLLAILAVIFIYKRIVNKDQGKT